LLSSLAAQAISLGGACFPAAPKRLSRLNEASLIARLDAIRRSTIGRRQKVASHWSCDEGLRERKQESVRRGAHPVSKTDWPKGRRVGAFTLRHEALMCAPAQPAVRRRYMKDPMGRLSIGELKAL
jgi:hypothetical protein